MQTIDPIQLWMPMFSVGPEASDLAEFSGRSDWDGVQTVWVLPEEIVKLSTEVWWFDGYRNLKSVALPGKAFERIDVFHIGPNRRVFNLNNDAYFPSGYLELEDIGQEWLSFRRTKFYDDRMEIRTEIPIVNEGSAGEIEKPEIIQITLTYSGVSRTGLESLMAIHSSERKRGNRGDFLPEVGRYFSHEVEASIPVHHIPSWEIGPEFTELSGLFPYGIAGATEMELAQIEALAVLSKHDPLLAENKVSQNYGRFCLKGTTTFEFETILPLLIDEIAHDGRPTFRQVGRLWEAVVKKAKISASPAVRRTLRDFRNSPEDSVDSIVRIDRVWGPLGLLWLNLQRNLSRGTRIGQCGRSECRNLTQGTAAKKYCDDSYCLSIRTAERQRRSRANRKSRHK